jgi:MoxR-like ATPase
MGHETLVRDLAETLKALGQNKGRARTVVLYGEPGNGKSSLARKLAEEMGIPMFRHFCAPWHGCKELCRKAPGEYSLAPVLDLASRSLSIRENCLVFLDEADKVRKQSFWDCLLSFIDDGRGPCFYLDPGRTIFVLGANRIQRVPSFILRRALKICVCDSLEDAKSSVTRSSGVSEETAEFLLRLCDGATTGRRPSTKEFIYCLDTLRRAKSPSQVSLAVRGWLLEGGEDLERERDILASLIEDKSVSSWESAQFLKEALEETKDQIRKSIWQG